MSLIELRPDSANWEGHLLLADYECAHGSLPSDTVIECDCWTRPAEGVS